jgi:diguanylate cyclase (GGDEF)-like protein
MRAIAIEMPMSREAMPGEFEALERMTREFERIRQRFQLEERRIESTRGGWGGFSTQRPPAAPAVRALPSLTLALLFVELDCTQPIDNEDGPVAGAEWMRTVEARLVNALGVRDKVSPMGGGTFACQLVHAQPREMLVQLARNVFEALSAPMMVGSVALSVRPSIGIAIGPTDGSSFELLLESARAAMARATHAHTGYAFYDPRLDP